MEEPDFATNRIAEFADDVFSRSVNKRTSGLMLDASARCGVRKDYSFTSGEDMAGIVFKCVSKPKNSLWNLRVEVV